MNKILLLALVLMVCGIAIWELSEYWPSSSRFLEVPVSDSDAGSLGLYGGLLEVPVAPKHKLVTYAEVYVDDEFVPERSYRSELTKAHSPARIGITLLNPDELLPPEMDTRQRKLVLHHANSTSSDWIKIPWDSDSLIISFGYRASQFAEGKPVCVATLTMSVQKNACGEPRDPRPREWRVELLAEQKPMTPAELAQPSKAVVHNLEKPVTR